MRLSDMCCDGVFSLDECTIHTYTGQQMDNGEEWRDVEVYICDECYTKAIKDKGFWGAHKKL